MTGGCGRGEVEGQRFFMQMASSSERLHACLLHNVSGHVATQRNIPTVHNLTSLAAKKHTHRQNSKEAFARVSQGDLRRAHGGRKREEGRCGFSQIPWKRSRWDFRAAAAQVCCIFFPKRVGGGRQMCFICRWQKSICSVPEQRAWVEGGQRDDHRVEGTGHGNRWSLVATQDPIKKDGRADLFLDPPCRANVPQRERIRIQKLESSLFWFNVMLLPWQ